MRGQIASIALLLAGIASAIASLRAPVMMLGTRPAPAAAVSSPFVFTFAETGTLAETGGMNESSSPFWWLNSGGQLLFQNGFGSTMAGDAPADNPWRARYAASNPRDTDQGLHPQNLFRLVSRSTWDNVSMQASFLIVRDEPSDSPNRNGSNGLLLMTRYELGGQTLYYAGVRVDGTAVIKKKYDGTYYTLAQTPVFAGRYARSGTVGSQNLLPHGVWITLLSTTATNADGSVTVSLYMLQQGAWRRLLSVVDRGDSEVSSTQPIVGAHFVGIRTDFMDVYFSDVRIEDLQRA